MKRRDLLTKIFPTLGLALGVAPKLITGQNDLKDTLINEVILSTCGDCKLIKRGNEVILPSNPEVYTTIFELEVEQGLLPSIIGNSEMVDGSHGPHKIKNPGRYILQYLGPYYGWQVS